MDETKLDPAWKQAAMDFIALDPQPGMTVDDDWLNSHFDLNMPTEASAEEWSRFQLKRLRYTDEFKRMLAEKHSIILSDRHEGKMRVLAPGEVAEYTESKAVRELRATLRKQTFRMRCTNLIGMTQEELKRHMQTQARIQLKVHMMREADRLELDRPSEKPAVPSRLRDAQQTQPENA